MNKLNQILSEQIELIKPDKETIEKINKISKEFIDELHKKIKNKKISAEIFVGGSLAKKTLIKKKNYDVDIFVRFDKKYLGENISELLGKILDKNAKRVHGSRDYYQIKFENVTLEIIPVIKIKKPEEAINVTDLSYFHVKYVLNKLNRKNKLCNEIILAKSFCHGQNCYGAESYIRGFSGYALELLIIHYNGFENFLKKIVGNKNKIIIDDSKFYKNKNILAELNEAKIQSPIILIDPTFRERNALAGLGKETFEKFKGVSDAFLKKPSRNFFKEKNIYEEFKNKNKNFNIIQIKTNKQTGDISGTKSRKFYEFFINELKKEFIVKDSNFEYYEDKNIAQIYVCVDKKSDEIKKGPLAKDRKNYQRFIKANKNVFTKNGNSYKKISHNLNLKDYVKKFKKEEDKIIKSMSIRELELIS